MPEYNREVLTSVVETHVAGCKFAVRLWGFRFWVNIKITSGIFIVLGFLTVRVILQWGATAKVNIVMPPDCSNRVP